MNRDSRARKSGRSSKKREPQPLKIPTREELRVLLGAGIEPSNARDQEAPCLLRREHDLDDVVS